MPQAVMISHPSARLHACTPDASSLTTSRSGYPGRARRPLFVRHVWLSVLENAIRLPPGQQSSPARMKRRPLPLMADRPETPVLQPTRIKRNTACTSCRDAKVRCNPSASPDQPCQRCAKLHLTCLVDKAHKRISRRSKLDELVQEIQSIKESVGSASSTTVPHPNALAAPSREPAPEQISIVSPSGASSASSHHAAARSVSTGVPAALSTPVTTQLHDASSEPGLPRTLGSYPFSGDDIDYYFNKYFEFYHPYMPVVRLRDPNKCYETCPLLFWTIIYVGSRRYAKSTSIVPFLSEEIRRQAFAALSDIALSLHTINAIILICSWNFPGARLVNEPSALLSSAITNAALLLGIHTGRGGHPEYSHGPFQNNYTDEAVTYTWAGLNIVSQRVSSYTGLPPVTALFNQTIQNTIDGRTPFHVPSSFRILLECQKFSNHVNKMVLANLEGSSGVSPHVVQVLEDEWNVVQGMICSERADDLDKFNALLVRLDIQIFYFTPAPGYNPESLKQQILRAYHTAASVLQNAEELDQKVGFLGHITHPQMRSLATAGCVVFKLLRSSYMQFLDRKSIEATASNAVVVCQRMSIMDGDLPQRLSLLFKTFLELNHSAAWATTWQNEEPTVSSFPHRLGAGVTFDCLIRWKSDGTMKRSGLLQQQQASNHAANGNGEDADTLMSSNGPDSLGIDWTFMDDFDWNWTPPNLGPPVYLWHGMPR
ncbi:hypothetical protein F4802DRAFT_594061 [Xylaria palmicola]|nr:hypothetical protein F4802DRAFT_594061 [Xylaria palmicola]